MGGVVPGAGKNKQTEVDTTVFNSLNAQSDGLGKTEGGGKNTLDGMSAVVAQSGSTLPQVSSSGGSISTTYHVVTTVSLNSPLLAAHANNCCSGRCWPSSSNRRPYRHWCFLDGHRSRCCDSSSRNDGRDCPGSNFEQFQEQNARPHATLQTGPQCQHRLPTQGQRSGWDYLHWNHGWNVQRMSHEDRQPKPCGSFRWCYCFPDGRRIRNKQYHSCSISSIRALRT
jgi:hypothetical protein